MLANQCKHSPPATAGNENTGLLKIIAMVSMVVDHVGLVFFPRVPELRLLGRIALPLFAWCLVIGSIYTRSRWKYALRLLAVGILSQPLSKWMVGHPWDELNIFFTLLLGLLALWGMEEKRYGSHIWAPLGALVAACVIQVDYGWKGVAFILLLYACRTSKAALVAGVSGFCLYWATGTIRMASLFGVPMLREWPLLPYAEGLPSVVCQVQFWAVLSLPFLLIPMKKRVSLPQWVGYVFYPLHLLVIAFLYRGLGIR